MSTRWQALIFTLVVLISASLTRVDLQKTNSIKEFSQPKAVVQTETNPSLFYEKASFLGSSAPIIPRGPSRNWSILDPNVKAEAVLIQSLDNQFPFFHHNIEKTWPMASLTKLLTAVVVLEDIGENKKIPVDQAAVATEGEAGKLKSGEVYAARDLLKIMLLTSSNDAAAAFENYLGRDEFVKRLNGKAAKIGMTHTILHDASGLSDLNYSTASDLLRLVRYIIAKEPDIFNWTRLQSFLVQPINDTSARTIQNINVLANRSDFLGGKTGTSSRAGENLAGLFSLGSERLVVIILGSPNRVAELEFLFDWLKKAYTF
jgi:D-alanyl-D-alanine carboxypeptidase